MTLPGHLRNRALIVKTGSLNNNKGIVSRSGRLESHSLIRPPGSAAAERPFSWEIMTLATSNPAFNHEMFAGYDQVYGANRSTAMTVQGTIGKTFALLAILSATAI